MATTKPITRDQLAKFLPDHETIKAFERLLRVTADLSESDVITLNRLIVESGYAAGVADNKAEARTMAPVVDYVDFTKIPAHSNKPARLAWNADDDTLNIHHTGGVTQQAGIEQYYRFQNNTGAAILNGEVVGFDFVAGVTNDEVVPFLADGSVPMLNIIGTATQNIPVGEYGRATVYGAVRDIDTTGTPYGETWAQGDILYASPTVAGGITNVPPTAPAWRIPIGMVLTVGVLGKIFSRPTIDQPLYYGEFVKISTQTPTVINTAYPITFSSANIANGLSIGATTSHIIAEFAGLYKFEPSIQLVSTSASVKNVWLWFRVNGVDVANSATIVSIESGTAIVAPLKAKLLSLEASDYVELMWAADNVNVSLQTTAATAFSPAAPGAILVVTQEQQ